MNVTTNKKEHGVSAHKKTREAKPAYSAKKPGVRESRTQSPRERQNSSGATKHTHSKPMHKRGDFSYRSGSKLQESIADMRDRSDSAEETIADLREQNEDLKARLDALPKAPVCDAPKIADCIVAEPGAESSDPPAPIQIEETFNVDLTGAVRVEKQIEAFWWDETFERKHIPYLVIPLLLTLSTIFVALPIWITYPVTALITWFCINQLPKRHNADPQHALLDHTDDRRPDAHRMLDATRPSEYYKWKVTATPLPVFWGLRAIDLCKTEFFNFLSSRRAAIDQLLEVFGLDLEENLAMLECFLRFNLRECLYDTWDKIIEWYKTGKLVMKCSSELLGSKPSHAVKLLLAWIVYIYSGLYIQVTVVLITTFYAIRKFHITMTQAAKNKDIICSNGIIKQLSVLKCCDPFSSPLLARERINLTARSICSVNFDEDWMLKGERIVEQSATIAFHAFMDYQRRMEGFRPAV